MLGKVGNLLLMGLLPIALTAPLAVSEVDFWFYSVREEISIAGSLAALHESGDILLFTVILCLSVLGPYLRLILMTAAAFSSPEMALRIRPALELVGRFSLIDVIIISLLVISFRVPEFKLQWGFYLVLWLWVLDMLASWSIWNRLSREAALAQRVRRDAPKAERARPPVAIADARPASPVAAIEAARARRAQNGARRREAEGRRDERKVAPSEAAEETPPPRIAGIERGEGIAGRAAAWTGEVTDRALGAAADAPRAFGRLRGAFSRPDRSSEPD